jgi:outer membrane lipoprotein carrier protein
MTGIIFAVWSALSLSAPEVVLKVQSQYDATGDWKAAFKQVWENPAYGQTRTAYGYVYLRKPGRMRWNYVKPDKKSIVSDGRTLWVYEQDDGQIFRQDVKAAELPSAVAFLIGGKRLADEFEVTPVPVDDSPFAGPGRVVLKLVPKVPTAQYRHAFIVVDDQDWLVRETIVVDHQGATNHLTFTSIERNTKIGDSKFQFVPPAGINVIDPKTVLPQQP